MSGLIKKKAKMKKMKRVTESEFSWLQGASMLKLSAEIERKGVRDRAHHIDI